MADYMSYSKVKTYTECPMRYRLERIDKVWQRPSGWLDHGTAVHSGIEAMERSGRTMPLEEAQKIASDEYRAGINRLLAETPNADFWSQSGPYKGYGYTSGRGRYYESDLERRARLVPEMVEKYYTWTEKHPEDVIWVAEDGTPGIELGFDVDLDGVRARGYIDQVLRYKDGHKPDWVVVDSAGRVHVRDVKTGAQPGDALQLKVYAVALEDTYGVQASTGDYWMGKEGCVMPKRKPYDLTVVSRQEVVDVFHTVNEGIKSENWDPKPGEHCDRCSVRTSCPVWV